ncbi:MAG: DUF488 domain-containing protein [Armatimonadota bacterium]|nr:DUF488 domain-containing protein [Armatimonadota bacterium]
MTIYTIGHTKKNLKKFIELLTGAGVDAVIDIRLNNKSQLAGYAKQDDLSFLLETCFNIRYLHLPELAPTKELLDRYRTDKNWQQYELEFTEIIRERDAIARAMPVISEFERPCLLCSEHQPAKCHRRLVAELFAARDNGLEVVHLP